ncbi:hypothetical protein BTM25_30930 [Actinomadura rubteroloni]|uniref:Uncharacterized protein n=1 Tax=Actinomadura rubteroloni TaxID=1926885 RepID=A0A2P4UHC8_9ACTN|nr:hypothetical protein [Actinomadura rubteroloni]POM24464.1 hypothetical protein BTM25_30930 [Actinomadura rubteroloni]
MTAERDTAGLDEEPTAAATAAAVRGLQDQFPGVRVWYGKATRSWWALVPLGGGSRLLEAAAPQTLRDAILNARALG